MNILAQQMNFWWLALASRHTLQQINLPRKGQAVLRKADGPGWKFVDDHRGEMVYSTEMGAAVTVTQPGDYPVNTTTLAPATPYDSWDDNKWVIDTAAKRIANISVAEQKKAQLRAAADDEINWWQDALCRHCYR